MKGGNAESKTSQVKAMELMLLLDSCLPCLILIILLITTQLS